VSSTSAPVPHWVWWITAASNSRAVGQRHLRELADVALGGTPRVWRTDRMATVVTPQTGRITADAAALAKHLTDFTSPDWPSRYFGLS
jgi:hypothetical protein